MKKTSESETLKCQDNFIKALKEVADEITGNGKNKIEGSVTFGDGFQEVDIKFSIEVSGIRNIEKEPDEPRDENGQTFDQWADDNFCR